MNAAARSSSSLAPSFAPALALLAALVPLAQCTCDGTGAGPDGGPVGEGEGEGGEGEGEGEGEPVCDAGQTACGGDLCCVDGETTCVSGACVDDAVLVSCADDDDCAGDTFCNEDAPGGARCEPFDLPDGPANDESCSVLVPLGVFNPSIQCEWQPEDSRAPCTLLDGDGNPLVGNPGYPHALTGGGCTGREVCVDPDVTDADTSRVCIDPHRQILSTPMVVRFRFPAGSAGNPDGVAGDRPSLVFTSYDSLDGGAPSGTSNGVVRVVDGQTCRTLYTIDGVDPATSLPLFTMGSSSVALGDVDRAPDGRPEIVAHAHGGGLWAFTYDAANDRFQPLWHSKNADGSLNQHNRGTLATDAFGFESFSLLHWSGPAIHDLDDDGSPEVLMSGAVFDAQGTALFDADAAFEAQMRFVGNGQFPVIADVDLDGAPELVTGDSIFDWSGPNTGWTPSPGFTQDAGGFDGFVAVGDFGDFDRRDGTSDVGFPEIVVVNNTAGGVLVQTSDGQRVFGPFPVPGGGLGGPPTVGDFDGDGRAEFAEAGGRAYTIFDLDCAVDAPTACSADADCGAGLACPAIGRCSLSSTACNDTAASSDCPGGETCIQLSTARECVPSGCQGNGFRWSQVSQDLSSNRTGSSIFDFEGDGNVEAVYADECYTRIYRGADGVVLFSQFHTSCTWYENAIIADVDGDLRSEIVVGSNENCGTGASCFANAFVANAGADGVGGTADDVRVDPIFPGLRCASGEDCASGTCVDELCRCTADAECGGGDFVCAPVLAGSTSVTDQSVCRAAFRADDSDGRPGITGVRVYKDALDRWVGSRPIWNQHTYSITNVNDDGTIPKTSDVANNWQTAGLNNYRQNAQGDLDPAAFPDLTGGDAGGNVCSFNPDQTQTLTLETRVCNRGTLDVGAGVPVAFYEGDAPDPAALTCDVLTTQTLSPGSCEAVQCLVTPAPTVTATDYLVVVDDDGTGRGDRAECHEGNNRALLRNRVCVSQGG